MRVVVLDQEVASFALFQTVYLLVLAQVHVVETQNCSFRWKCCQLFNENSKINCFELIRVAKNTDYSELVVHKFGFIFPTFENTTNVKFFGKAFLLVDWFVIWCHCFLEKVAGSYILELSYSHHFAWVKTGQNHFCLFNASQGHGYGEKPIMILFNLTILEPIYSSLYDCWLFALRMFMLVIEHAQ